MLSSQDRATAHYGAVIGLKATEDGMYLLSAGWVRQFVEVKHFLDIFC